MALVLKDRIKETSNTTGQGTLTLTGAVNGFRTFADIGNANTTYYCIADGNNFEVGIGTYTASGTTLARTTVLQTSAGNTTKISCTGNQRVFVTQPASKAAYLATSVADDEYARFTSSGLESRSTAEVLSDIGAAPLASPTLTGNPVAPTQSASNNSTRIATTAYADTAVSNLVDSSPDALNTLNELAAALGDDANFSTTVTNSIATKLPLSGGAMTGAITTNSTFDGVDIATRDAVLTSTTTTANAALPKSGGAMTGAITTNSTFDGVDIATRDGVLTSTTATANAALPKAGGTMSGALDMGSSNITTTGKIIYSNLYAALDDLPSASTYHGMFAHVHATGKGYFAHGGAWIELANNSQLASYALLAGANFTGKIGVGLTPSAWDVGTSGRLPVQVGFGSISGRLNDLQSELSNNCYNVSTGNAPQWAGITRYAKTQMEYFGDGSIRFKTAPTVDQSTFDSSPNFTFTETVRIDDSGRLLTSGLTGTIGSSSAKLQASGTNAPSALLNRTNDGVLVDFYKNGSTNLGSIGMSGDGPSFGTATQHIVVHNGKAMPGTNTGSALDDTMDLGSSSSQFKDLYLSGTADATNFKINGDQGTDGQVLTSTGSGVAWEDASGGGGGGSGISEAAATVIAVENAIAMSIALG